MKKSISLLLTALMLLSAFSFASFADESERSLPFTDVKEGAWYYEGIDFCYFMGYVSGMTETTFEPNGTLTRAQFVQILAMYDNVELEAYKNNDSGFDDVKSDHWYNAPVCWAVEQGFVAGLSADRFGPNEKITREQLARLLYLYAEARGYDVSRLADLSGYTDKPSDWAYTQVQWAVAAGIISGMTETTIAPRDSATRAQACRMIMSYFDFECYGYRDMGDEMQVLYDALVRYIQDEGVEYPDGKHIGLIIDNGDEAYVTEYVLETGEICLVYVTEPIPGGTDIFDTSYRERVIFIPDILTGSLWWQYTYESEDSTVKISAYGTDADEDSYANLTFEGISEEDAKAKFDAAMDNTVLHFLGLMIDAASYIAYDELVDYVSTNGIAFAGGIDLVKDEGDRGYVAEYDPENDAIYFIYVSEPIPGGTDIFDTSYREKAIIMFDPPLNSEYFIYTYESEDGSIKLNADGFYDGFEVVFDSFEYTGLSEEEATAKIKAALEETMSYYTEIMSQTIA